MTETLCAFGQPGAFTAAAFTELRLLADTIGIPVVATDQGRDASNWDEPQEKRLILSQYPDGGLVALAKAAPRRLVLADRAEAGADYLAKTAKLDLSAIVRALSAASAVRFDLSRSPDPGTRILHSDTWFPNPGTLRAELQTFLTGAPSNVLPLHPPPDVNERSPEMRFSSPATARVRNLPSGFEWPAFLFLAGDNPGTAFTLADLAGPARCLVYGPYLHLPAGTWTADVAFELKESFDDRLALEAVAGTKTLSTSEHRTPGPGKYTWRLKLQVDDPHVAIEIRIHLRRGAIEGVLTNLTVTLRPAI